MKLFALPCRHIPTLVGLVMLALNAPMCLAEESNGISIHGAGWFAYDKIGNSSQTDNGTAEYTGKEVLSSGAQLTIGNRFFERLSINAGLGVASGSNLSKSEKTLGGYSPPTTGAYVAAANFTYDIIKSEESNLFLRGGLFPYNYNPDVKNLGLYLMRGPVYPGVLISGFETKHVMPVANVMGLQLHHQIGGFQQDLLLTSETEFYPYFDISPVYIAHYQLHPSFKIGAGVNFYHLIPVDGKLTDCQDTANCSYSRKDASGNKIDTTMFAYSGTKLMTDFVLDPKEFFDGAGLFGEEDLKLYGEIALIGLKNGPAYKAVYGDYLKRMPIMIGFNIPAFHWLDHLSAEVEWYGAPYLDNLNGYKNTHDPVTLLPANPFPLDYAQQNVKRDNWKWSVHGAKMIQKHVKLSFQAANDHYRPGVFIGFSDNTPPLKQALLITPKNWYASTKIAYFF